MHNRLLDEMAGCAKLGEPLMNRRAPSFLGPRGRSRRRRSSHCQWLATAPTRTLISILPLPSQKADCREVSP